MADENIRNVNLDRLDAATRQFVVRLQESEALLRQAGETAQADMLAAARERAVGASAAPRTTEQIAADTQATRDLNAAREQSAAVELRNLEILKQQTAERIRQQQVLREAYARPLTLAEQEAGVTQARRFQPVYASEVGRGAIPASQLAGQQSALEEQRAAIARINAELAQVGVVNREIEAEYQKQLALQDAMASRAQALAARTQGEFLAYQAGAFREKQPPAGTKDLRDAPLPAIPGGAAANDLTKAEQAQLRLAQSTGTYSGYASQAALRTEALTTNLTALGIAQNESSSQMRRHGALTTEFISALARGEVTIQEFGYQIGATIGKFAGWTAAATATYGALAAVVAIGKGAIDSSSGVQQLTRTIDNVNADRAAKQFRDLSRDTNVSMKQVTDAVFAFSRTFHQQDEAVAVAGLGLKAYILDQVNVQDSVKATTALHQQFGLNVQQLKGYFDILATGQREYNARLQVTIPLLTTASGALRNAGTSAQDAATLAIYAARVTQAPGPQLATALARSAATFVKKPAAQATFEALGLPGAEAITNYGAFLKTAILKSATLSPQDNARLAQALGGPLLGTRIFSRLLNPVSAAVLPGIEQINAQSAAGKLDEETQRRLGQVDQRITQIGHSFQRLGAILAGSGAAAPLGLLLTLLDNALSDAEKIGEAFDRLPGPLRTALQLMVELRAVMLLTQRTVIGASVANRTGLSALPGFGQSPAQLARSTQTIGTRTAITAVDADIEASTASVTRIGAEMLKMRTAADAMQVQMRGMVADSAEQQALMVAWNDQMSKIKDLEAAQTKIQTDIVAATETRSILAGQLAGLSQRRSPGYLSDQEVLDRQQRIQGVATGADAGAGAAAMGESVKAGAATGAAEIGGAIRDASAVGAAEYAAALRTASFLPALPGVIGDSAGTFATRLRGYMPSMGDLFKAGIGAFIGTQIIDAVSGPLGLPHAIQSSLNAGVIGGALGLAVGGPLGAAVGASLGASLGDIKSALGLSHPAVTADPGEAQRLLGEVAFYFQHQNRIGQQNFGSPASIARSASGPSPDPYFRAFAQYASEIAGLGGQLDRLPTSKLTQLRQESEQFLRNPYFSNYANDLQRLVTQLNTISSGRAGTKNPFAAVENLQPKDAQTLLDATAGSEAVNQDPQHLRSLARQLTFHAANQSRSTSPEAVKLISDAESKLLTAISDRAQRFADQAKLDQGNPAKQTQDIQRARQVYAQAIATQQRSLDEFRRQYANPTDAAYAQAVATRDRIGSQGLPTTQYDAQIAQLLQAKRVNDQKLRAAQHVLALLGIKINTALQQLNQTAFSDFSASVDAGTALANAGTEDKSAQLANTLAGDNRKVSEAAKLFTTRSDEYKNALANALQAQQQTVDNELALIQSRGKLATSTIQTLGPEGDLSRAVSDANQTATALSFARSHGLDPQKIIDLQTQLNDQRRQIAQQTLDNAKANRDAAFALTEASQVDPVPRARTEYAQAQADLAGLTGAARTQQEATIIQKRIALRDAVVQQDLQNLDFEHSINQLTDQAYVRGLEQILRTKKLSIAERQDIRKKIYDLENQSSNSQELNVGNITLPTLYDVRRMARQGTQTAPQIRMTTNNRVELHVHRGEDVPRVVNEMERLFGSSVKATARSAGLI